MDEEKGRALHRREGVEGENVLAATRGQRGLALQEERDVRAECSRDLVELFRRERLAEKLVEAEERTRRVTAAAAEPGRKRDALFEMKADAFFHAGRLQESHGRAMHEIARIEGQTGLAAGQLDAAHLAPRARQQQPIVEIHRVHDGFELVETVGAFTEDVQQQVDLAGGLDFESHAQRKSANSRVLAPR